MSRSRNTFEVRVLRKVKIGPRPAGRVARSGSVRSVHAGQGHGERLFQPMQQTNLRPTFADRQEALTAKRARGSLSLGRLLAALGGWR